MPAVRASARVSRAALDASSHGSPRDRDPPCGSPLGPADKSLWSRSAWDLRDGPEFLRHLTQEPELAPDERDLAFAERRRVERDEEDRLPHRDGFAQVVQEGEDRAEVVVRHEVLEPVEEDDRVLAHLDEMLDRQRHLLRWRRPDRVLLRRDAAQPE